MPFGDEKTLIKDKKDILDAIDSGTQAMNTESKATDNKRVKRELAGAIGALSSTANDIRLLYSRLGIK